MSKVLLGDYAENARKQREVAQAIYEEIKEAILARLDDSRGTWVRYWNLCNEICEEELISQGLDESLVGSFRNNFKTTIERLESERVIRKSWEGSTGGIIMLPEEEKEVPEYVYNPSPEEEALDQKVLNLVVQRKSNDMPTAFALPEATPLSIVTVFKEDIGEEISMEQLEASIGRLQQLKKLAVVPRIDDGIIYDYYILVPRNIDTKSF